MSAKKQSPTSVAKSRHLKMDCKPGQSLDRLTAEAAAAPHLAAATIITDYGGATWGDLSITDLAQVLRGQMDDAKAGDLSHAEAMLCAQATALNALFGELARRAAVNMGRHLGATEAYLRLALRAQSQSRATVETLAAIKNPPVVFAKQANIAHGPQQVNNTARIARARESENPPSELLEAEEHGQWLDPGATRSAGAGDQALAAVETVHRPAHGRGKGRRKP